jgi:hypothetical protein
VKRNTRGLRLLLDAFLGPHWRVVMSDVTAGTKGNQERMAYLYDSRRVTPSGLAAEIVLPPTGSGDPAEQFDRTPYIVGFQAEQERFALLTAHIRYGDAPELREPELRALAQYTAKEIRDRSRFGGAEETSLIVLGDFNIDQRSGNPLFDAFVSQGLWVPTAIRETSTTTGEQAKHYDQIAWFREDLQLVTQGRAGTVDFVGAVFKELTASQMSYRVSDHFPLWVEFLSDRSVESMARVIGAEWGDPDPFRGVLD